MRSHTTQSCYDQLVLQRLLAEQLAGAEESAVLDHIEDCDECRNSMARLAGGGELVNDIKHHLADHGVADAGLDTVLESDLVEAEIEQIVTILGPTDDPHMMGRLGTYEVVSIIGRGSTGVVFKALDRGLNRFVAIKMLVPSFAANGPARERFAREGRSIASVRDQHVVQVFAVSEHKGLPFIVMEYLPTGSLAQRISREGTLQTVEVVRIGLQIATALAAAHRQGIVHRDVKPANVLLANGVNRALVTDFGLARLLDEASMTHSGAISGTPQFMSPEQAQGATVDHRSDLFSLGSVLYAACSGHSPFRSETIFGVIKRVCESEPRPIHEVNPEIESWLCDFIDKLHCKNPDDRFQTAEEVAAHLEAELAFSQSPTTIPQPQRPWQKAPNNLNSGSRSKLSAISICTITVGLAAAMSTSLLDSKDTHVSSVPMDSKAATEFNRRDSALAPVTANEIDSLKIIIEDAGWPRNRSFQLGIRFFNDNQFPEAIQHFSLAAEEPELEGIAQYHIGCSFSHLDKKPKAIEALKKAVLAGFGSKEHFLCDENLKPIRNAKQFRELVEQLEESPRVRFVLADPESRHTKEEYIIAEAENRAILEQNPDCEVAALNLAMALHVQGHLDEALPWHQRTSESECYSHLGLYNIACYHSLKGQRDLAFSFWQKAIEAGFTNVQHFNNDEDLDPIRDDARFEEMLSIARQAADSFAECNTMSI